ncbi:DUF922 domain-containing protein [uncultured Bartonella sp.]|uniref:DUF922 domain-containing Zn-dependent protease n=1 Tax=uncultured Bartonella sp. TaxID=104108 RepID=UPI00261D0699|nr:DUF922 domain-containing protein [uncultured Bartonella sp.]
MFKKAIGTLAAICFLLVPFPLTAEAARIYKTVSYYTLSGTTPEQLDKALSHNGPYLKSTASHHPGATTISFDPRLKLVQDGKYCKVASVNVDIHAKMSLPRWKQRASTKSIEMALVWDTLSRDIKRHEESHIVIARAHATKIEHAVKSLPYRSNCNLLKQDIEKTTRNILDDHDNAQKEFDRVEAINFDHRFINLLVQRLKQLEQAKN